MPFLFTSQARIPGPLTPAMEEEEAARLKAQRQAKQDRQKEKKRRQREEKERKVAAQKDEEERIRFLMLSDREKAIILWMFILVVAVIGMWYLGRKFCRGVEETEGMKNSYVE